VKAPKTAVVSKVYRYALFDTAIGTCGIVWSAYGIAAVQLPEKTASSTKRKLLDRFADSAEESVPTGAVKNAVREIVRLLKGEAHNFSKIELDLNGVPPFHRKVYIAARQVPPGQIVSYGDLARAAGSPAAARAVGQAMARNPFALLVPCHRIMGHDGSAVGFSSFGGCSIKQKLLALEGVDVPAKAKRQSGKASSVQDKAGSKVKSAVQPARRSASASTDSSHSPRVSRSPRSSSATDGGAVASTGEAEPLSRRERKFLPAAQPASGQSAAVVGLRFVPGQQTALPFDSVAAIAHLSKRDKKMGRLIQAVGPFRLELDEMLTPFETLAESIVYQQLTGKAAATIFSRVKALYGGTRLPPAKLIMQTPEADLRGAGLSTAKALAIKDLADKHHRGLIPTIEDLHRMSDDEIIERLTAVRGIGRWTVEMLLMFRLGRPDVLPIHDYGVRKGFARTYGYEQDKLPTPKQLEAHGEQWRPYRSVAAWYLWRALELPGVKR
jgi:O-6-methylguanine DNA methyltransferase